MRFSLDWLRQYAELPESPARIAELLAAAGLPVDAVEPWGADHALDVDVLANRPDCMCHLGLARELAARLGRPLQPPTPEPNRGSEDCQQLAAVEVRDPDLCPRYTALVLTEVSVRRSPDWLQDRLASIGQRSINNVVDVTNFVLHELGQPLHAFDLDRLEGHRIVVRRAGVDETLHTLDGELRRLQRDDLLIADAARPVALAGIMGGADSEISLTTKRVLLESAHFAPLAIRRTARRLGMHTDASHRFERGSDRGITLTAALRAAALILETGGGVLADGALDVEQAAPPRRLTLSMRRLERLLGLRVAPERAGDCLAALGFCVDAAQRHAADTVLPVSVPSWRLDVEREVDLVEEVARMIGYDAVPSTVPAFHSERTGAPRPTAALDRGRSYMASAGFVEAVNFPMSDPAAQRPFLAAAGGEARLLRIDNPMSAQMCVMRASLIPGLLANVARNRNRGQDSLRLFETGRVFLEARTSEPADEASLPLPEEHPRLAAVACGLWDPPHWRHPARPVDAFDLKGVVEGLGRAVFGAPVELEPAEEADGLTFLAQGAGGRLRLGEHTVGCLGQLHGDLSAVADLPEELFVLEVDLSRAPLLLPPAGHRPLPRQPAADRDLALLLDADISYARLEATIRAAGGELLESLHLFDRYAGDPVPAGKVSLAVRLTFRHPEHTLTAEEVQQVQDRIVARLTSVLGATLRDS